MLKKFRFVYFFLILFFSFQIKVFANNHIVIIGNKNISSKTIFSLAPKNLNLLSIEDINNYQKKLYDTGFFENVIINLQNKKLFITVIENPLINFFFIEGIKNKGIKERLYNISKIKENSIYQTYLIKDDIKNISKILRNDGYLNNKIEFQIIKIKDNKVNIFYNIKLNNKFKIKNIFFIGDKFYKSSVLENVIYSSSHGWWKFFSSTSTPSESLIDIDINRLKNYYLKNGFYDVQINSNSVKLENNNYATITYSINAGNRFIISDVNIIDISKSLNKDNIDYIKKILDEFLNNYYDNYTIKKRLNIINDFLSKSNFFLEANVKVDKIDLNKIKLSFILTNIKNKQYVDKVTIEGNNITDDFVIRNYLKFFEGDLLSSSKLTSSIDQIKGSGIFKEVNYQIVPINDDKVEIKINVVEQATGQIAGGAGAGSSGVGISFGLKERNFLGKGINLNSNINIGSQKIIGNINYSDNDFRNSGKTFSNNIFIESNDYKNSSYQNKAIGNITSYSYEIYDSIFLNPGIAVDYDKVTPNNDASELIKRRAGSYYTSKFFYNVSKNTKNKEILPTEGYVFGIGQGLSLISDISYINNKIFGSYYHEYLENFVGTFKYKIESINGFNKDIKFSDRLFVSSNNLRGFENRGIGPKIDNDFIGGNYSYYTNISTTVPNGMPEKWNAITNIFFDSANVWGIDDGSTEDTNKIRTSVGFGLSWMSPLGPISFTYAEPITKSSTDNVENFNFKIGSAF